MSEETATIPETNLDSQAETIIEKEEEINLADRLAQATERKAEPENLKVNTSFFGSDDDLDPIQEDKPNSKKEEIKEIAVSSKTTDKERHSSAEIAVGMVDLGITSILIPLHGWKFKRKFKKEEITKIDDYIDDSEFEQLEDEEDKKLKKKWNRLLKKHEKNKSGIPLDDKEKGNMENAFFKYFQIKQTKELSPEWLLAMSVITAIGTRTVDFIVD